MRQRRPHSTTPATLRRITGWGSPAQLSSLTQRSVQISRYSFFPSYPIVIFLYVLLVMLESSQTKTATATMHSVSLCYL